MKIQPTKFFLNIVVTFTILIIPLTLSTKIPSTDTSIIKKSHDLLTPDEMEYIEHNLKKIKRLNKSHKDHIHDFYDILLTLIRKSSIANRNDQINLIAIQDAIINNTH